MFGELIPIGGGDPIPLLKKTLLVGRRESCDVVLRFSNVSAHHCQLTLNGGYWYVRDMKSRNGVKVNGTRVDEKRLDPGDVLSIARHKYALKYSPAELGAVGPPPPERADENVFGQSLLKRAGLDKRQLRQVRPTPHDEPSRYNVDDDGPGQIETPRYPQ